MARRRFQKGQIIFSETRKAWLGRYREDVLRDGKVIRTRPQVVLGTRRELPTQRLAARKLDEILSRINAPTYQPTRTATVNEFAERWRREVLAKRKPSTVRAAKSHLDRHILPQLGKLRLDQISPENQQIFINQLVGASRKTVLNILSTLSSVLTTAKAWGYSARDVERRRLVLPERNTHVAAHFSRSQVESIFALAVDPWRTFFVLLTLTGMRAGEALGLQWGDIDFEHSCIHVRRSAWQGRVQSTKTQGSAAAITLPPKLADVLKEFRKQNGRPNPNGFLFVTRNGRPPSSNKVVEYQLWPVLDALSIPRCGLHAFRHTVASLIVDSGFSLEVAQRQLRHSDAKTTLGYIHLRGDLTEQAMATVADSLKLDVVGRGDKGCGQYLQ
ncbi:MAG TPA: site-specific integrase [Candidatus Acidoferrales bacterium]|nr:site-specific integrase [Candidatus Acidoferrales bacterium]